MLQVSPNDIQRCGGFLSALADVAAEYFHQKLGAGVQWTASPPPRSFIVHKAPHLDDYAAELFFRASLGAAERQREFREMALYAENDTTARVEWPTAAVFGIGGTLPCGKSALYLFDEHLSGGGRDSDSCAHIVAQRCFSKIPESTLRLLEEVGQIDSAGGAHELHLNNLLKTCHVANYIMYTKAAGTARSNKLPDEWKRAIVSALLAATAYCLDNNIDITDDVAAKDNLKVVFAHFEAHPPFEIGGPQAQAINRLRSNSTNIASILKRARIQSSEGDVPQLLVLPFLITAAMEAWGKEIAQFLITHLMEAEILANVHYRRIGEMAEECFSDRRGPRLVYSPGCSLTAMVVPTKRFRGTTYINYVERDARHDSPLWILSCRHTNAIIQPDKALKSYLREKNCGIGIIFLENTKEGTKALFRGRSLDEAYWDKVVRRIQGAEPDLWYRPQPTAPFLLNGNAAHQYRPLSGLTLNQLARLCREVPT